MTSPYGGGDFIAGLAGPGAKFPQWTVSVPGYVLAHVNNAIEKGIAEAAVIPGKLIFFTSEKAARAYALSKGHPAIVSPASKLGGQKALDIGTEVIGGFALGNWFLRVGEILLGLVLIGVGVARITGVQNAISQIVKTKVPI